MFLTHTHPIHTYIRLLYIDQHSNALLILYLVDLTIIFIGMAITFSNNWNKEIGISYKIGKGVGSYPPSIFLPLSYI